MNEDTTLLRILIFTCVNEFLTTLSHISNKSLFTLKKIVNKHNKTKFDTYLFLMNKIHFNFCTSLQKDSFKISTFSKTR